MKTIGLTVAELKKQLDDYPDDGWVVLHLPGTYDYVTLVSTQQVALTPIDEYCLKDDMGANAVPCVQLSMGTY